ncbi:MAG: WhiB family transcriptional regulator [Actinomycetota bacterium]|nr:WhiB family transcriptional regulator [Actinomycetota bacterium]
MTWHRQATCLTVDPELFFPSGTTGASARQINHAKQICVSCPVRTACLEFALESRQDYGVWGGLTEEERRSLRRSRQRRARRMAATQTA